MAKTRETNFFKIGVFVLASIILIIVAILVFGSFHLFQRKLFIETYFNESVQGLSVGSPVKYRGIDIGQVKKITLVNNVYPLPMITNGYSRYVYVLMSINPDFMSNTSTRDMPAVIADDVKQGLRVKLALLDLTGHAYLEVNFTSVGRNSVLPIDWTPKHIYIPSTTSVLTRFTDNIQAVLAGLKDVNFKKLFGNIQDFAKNADKTMQKVNSVLTRTQSNIVSITHNAGKTLENTRQLTEKVKNNPSSILFDKPRQINPADL